MRQTLIPKVGNSDAVLISYYEVIRAIRNRDKLNMIEWMATRMMDYKLDRTCSSVFQPYIMALICSKTSFIGVDETLHKSFWPFYNKKGFL